MEELIDVCECGCSICLHCCCDCCCEGHESCCPEDQEWRQMTIEEVNNMLKENTVVVYSKERDGDFDDWIREDPENRAQWDLRSIENQGWRQP